MGDNGLNIFQVIRDTRRKNFYRKLLAEPSKCPFCGGSDILPDPKIPSEDKIVIVTECLDCGKSWEEVYKLVDAYESEE